MDVNQMNSFLEKLEFKSEQPEEQKRIIQGMKEAYGKLTVQD